LRPGLNIIVSSAYGEHAVAQIFPGLETGRFLRKPYRLAELLKMLG
jgi:hypothetical protein